MPSISFSLNFLHLPIVKTAVVKVNYAVMLEEGAERERPRGKVGHQRKTLKELSLRSLKC